MITPILPPRVTSATLEAVTVAVPLQDLLQAYLAAWLLQAAWPLRSGCVPWRC